MSPNERELVRIATALSADLKAFSDRLAALRAVPGQREPDGWTNMPAVEQYRRNRYTALLVTHDQRDDCNRSTVPVYIGVSPHPEQREPPCPSCSTTMELQWVCEHCGERVPTSEAPT